MGYESLHHRQIAELEEKRKQLQEEAQLNREKNLASERERLKIEREEKEREEKERIEEEMRLERIKHARKVAEEKSRTAAEQAKIRKESMGRFGV